MSNSGYFELGPEGKTVLTGEGVQMVKKRMQQIPPDQFKQFGATRSAFYLWVRGKPISSRGCQAIIRLMEASGGDPDRSLDDWTIEELVAALKKKGVKDVQIHM